MAVVFFISPYLTLYTSMMSRVIMACVVYSYCYSIITTTFACVSLLVPSSSAFPSIVHFQINNVSTPETAASVNGASASSVSISRLIAPVAGGTRHNLDVPLIYRLHSGFLCQFRLPLSF